MAKTSPQVKIRISRVNPGAQDIPLPAYSTSGASGMDLHACIAALEVLKPGETALIPTGFSMEIPPGYEAQVRPRSGLAIKHGIGILNSPGTIDSDYRGEVKVILTNFGKRDFLLHRGDRIAQLVVVPVARALWEECPAVEPTERGSGGFGHTGK
ncbi:MAG TPA: dUTP diphosphatase [Bacteroidota bacterium]|nr:dUTP diphosphatase [Bacteroidota bacterium]